MTQIVDMAAFRGPTAQMVDLSKFTFWGPPQDMDFFYKQSTRTGRAWLRSIRGRTVSYNQLVQDRANFVTAGLTCSISGGKLTISGTASITGFAEFRNIPTIAGHKYILRADSSIYATGDIHANTIYTATTTGGHWMRMAVTQGQTYNMVCPLCFTDLTQAGLDSIITTPEQFEAWQMEQFGHKGYLGYTPGKLVSVNPTGIKTTTPGGDEHTLPLDFSEHFPAGVNGLNGIFDEVVSDENGKFTDGGKRFGKVDLGDLTWAKTTTAVPNTTCFQAYLPEADFGVAICAKYYLAAATRYPLATKDKAFAPYNDTNSRNTIVVRDSDYDNATAADFKAAMSGVPLVFELDTPQHVTFTDPSDAVYPVTEGGTEQVLPVNGSEPTTGPLLGKVSYKQGRSAQ